MLLSQVEANVNSSPYPDMRCLVCSIFSSLTKHACIKVMGIFAMAKLSCRRYLTFVAILALTFHVLLGHEEDEPSLDKLIPDFLRGHVTSFAGAFPISKDSIQVELLQRASQFSCQNGKYTVIVYQQRITLIKTV